MVGTPHLASYAQDRHPYKVAVAAVQAAGYLLLTSRLTAALVVRVRRQQRWVVALQGALAPTALRAPDGRAVAVVVAAYQAAPRTTAAQEAQQAVVVEAARQLTGKAPVPVDLAATVCAASGLGKGAACAHIKSTPTA